MAPTDSWTRRLRWLLLGLVLAGLSVVAVMPAAPRVAHAEPLRVWATEAASDSEAWPWTPLHR